MMRIFERIRRRRAPVDPGPLLCNAMQASCCPFCGADIVHVMSEAKSFMPPRLYHEWHHAPGFCFLTTHVGRIMFMATDDRNAQELVLRHWNERAVN